VEFRPIALELLRSFGVSVAHGAAGGFNVTTVTAAYAAVVSTASFLVAFLAYRASGPKVTAQALVTGQRNDDQRLYLSVATNGSSKTTINVDGLLCTSVWWPGWEKYLKPVPRLRKIALEGPELPYRMPGYHIAHWEADLGSSDVLWHLSRELRPSDKPFVLLRIGGRHRRVPVGFVTEQVAFRGVNLPKSVTEAADPTSD
jgi:hypothetical protein